MNSEAFKVYQNRSKDPVPKLRSKFLLSNLYTVILEESMDQKHLWMLNGNWNLFLPIKPLMSILTLLLDCLVDHMWQIVWSSHMLCVKVNNYSSTLVVNFWGQGSTWSILLLRNQYRKNILFIWLPLTFEYVIKKFLNLAGEFNFPSQKSFFVVHIFWNPPLL
jgi:hypothetical protein